MRIIRLWLLLYRHSSYKATMNCLYLQSTIFTVMLGYRFTTPVCTVLYCTLNCPNIRTAKAKTVCVLERKLVCSTHFRFHSVAITAFPSRNHKLSNNMRLRQLVQKMHLNLRVSNTGCCGKASLCICLGGVSQPFFQNKVSVMLNWNHPLPPITSHNLSLSSAGKEL